MKIACHLRNILRNLNSNNIPSKPPQAHYVFHSLPLRPGLEQFLLMLGILRIFLFLPTLFLIFFCSSSSTFVRYLFFGALHAKARHSGAPCSWLSRANASHTRRRETKCEMKILSMCDHLNLSFSHLLF